MHTLTRDLIDHRKCPPGTHRLDFDRNRGEDGDPNTGQMRCITCLGPMMHCSAAARANSGDSGYQQTYVHVDATDQDRCPAEDDRLYPAHEDGHPA